MKNNKKKIVAVVVALAVVLAVWGIIEFLDEMDVASIVQLDVNPSIELQVDDDAEVIRAVALNQDAEKVLEGMKLRGADADTAVNAIIGSLLKHGYVDELANSILLSVEDKNEARGAKLQAELTEEINQILSATSVNAAILAQYVNDAGVDEMADELDISKGKAALIQSILEVNSTYEAKDLAKLSVNELNLVLSNPKNEVKDVVSTGSANDSAYIGRDKAKEAAFAHAGVAASDVRDVEVDFDYEYGKMVYEVEFASGEYEYDYSIDAENGEVLYSHREYDEDRAASSSNTTTSDAGTTNAGTSNTDSTNTGSQATENAGVESNNSEATDIGKEKAKSIALAQAGFTESQVTRLKVERDIDDGRIEYSVEFTADGKEYDYEISGADGKILDYDVEREDND